MERGKGASIESCTTWEELKAQKLGRRCKSECERERKVGKRREGR
jgi:hypothetical protein